MKRRVLFLLCVVVFSAMSVAAQRRVTNADLEGYRQARLRAEADLRADYVRRGLPSPEEMALRNEESAREAVELGVKLKADRLERDRMTMEMRLADRAYADYARSQQPAYRTRQGYESPLYVNPYVDGGLYNGGFFGGGGGFFDGGFSDGGDNDRRRRRGGRFQGQAGFYGGGQFNPVGPATRSRPLVRITRRR
ncbi:MAG: hypothetical protein WKF34_11315 [Pyrinomonadaceae bacterium]